MPEMTVDNNHVQIWRENGVIHREDGPAIILPDGSEKYCLHGKLHREGKPAVIYGDGTTSWFFQDKPHRVGGPSVTRSKLQIWHRHGLMHREDGPAFVLVDHVATWYLHGELIKEEPYHPKYWWVEEE